MNAAQDYKFGYFHLQKVQKTAKVLEFGGILLLLHH